MLPYPCCVHASASLKCLKLTMDFLIISCGEAGLKKNHRSTVGLEIRPQSDFPAFRALLPSASYSAGLSGRVFKPTAYGNGCLVRFFHIWRAPNSHYSLQQAATPNPASSNCQKLFQTTIINCSELLYPTGCAVGCSEFDFFSHFEV